MNWFEVLELARKANDHYSMSEREQELVWELAQTIPEGGFIVELGVCHGKTAVILAAVAQNKGGFYTGIDNFSLEGSLLEVEGLLEDSFGSSSRGRFWRLHSANTHDPMWGYAGEEEILDHCLVDLLLIDAGHDYDNVSQDCEIWIPQIRPGGIVIFDDVASGPTWRTDCHSAVREMMEKWCGDWCFAAGFGKCWAWRKPHAPQTS